MYINSRGCKVGTNFYEYVTNGKVTVENESEIVNYDIKYSEIYSVERYQKKNGEFHKLVYGKYIKVYDSKKNLISFKTLTGNISKHGIWKGDVIFFNKKINIESKFYKGSLVWEKGFYNTDRIAYEYSRPKEKLRIYDYEGKLMAKGRNFILNSGYGNFYQKWEGVIGSKLNSLFNLSLKEPQSFAYGKLVIYDENKKIRDCLLMRGYWLRDISRINYNKVYFNEHGEKISKLEYILSHKNEVKDENNN